MVVDRVVTCVYWWKIWKHSNGEEEKEDVGVKGATAAELHVAGKR
jgi:hypothetical protein